MRKGRDGEQKKKKKIMMEIAVHYRRCQSTPERGPTATTTLVPKLTVKKLLSSQEGGRGNKNIFFATFPNQTDQK